MSFSSTKRVYRCCPNQKLKKSLMIFDWSVLGTEKFILILSPPVAEFLIFVNTTCLCRFGNVKSVHIVKQGNGQTTCTVTCKLDDNALTAGFGRDLTHENSNGKSW